KSRLMGLTVSLGCEPKPLSSTLVVGDCGSSLVMVTLAMATACAMGANCTVNESDILESSMVGMSGASASTKAPASAPVSATDAIESGALPPLVTVMVLLVVVLPRGTEPKSTDSGLTVTAPAVPMPCSAVASTGVLG